MKPMIERQRRARINRSLEDLHALLRNINGGNLRQLSDTAGSSSSSANQRRIEKADILEQAVRFIKNLQSGQAKAGGASSSNNSSEQLQSPQSQPSGTQLAQIQQAFCAGLYFISNFELYFNFIKMIGYAECTRLTTNWLASNQTDSEKHSTSEDSHMSHTSGEDHENDSLNDEDGDGFLGGDDEDPCMSREKRNLPGNARERELRANLESHLIDHLNDRLTVHLSKYVPQQTAGRMIPTPPQSPKDLLLSLPMGGGPGVSNNLAYQQHFQGTHNMYQGFPTSSVASNGDMIYYDPSMSQQQQQQQQPGTSLAQSSGVSSEFRDDSKEALNSAVNFVQQLQQTRAAVAVGLGCWRPWQENATQ